MQQNQNEDENLKIEKEYQENHQVKITAEIEASQFEGYKHRAARKISSEHKIPGFRPGKAPYDIVKRNFGEDSIEREAIELLIDEVYPKVLDEAEVKPSGPGSLEKIVSTDPPTFEFIVPLMPEVELGDYKAIRKAYEYEPVTDKDVEEVLNNVQKGYAKAIPVEKPAAEGDMVSIHIQGTLTNPEEGEDAEIIKEMPYQVVIGDDENENTWPFEGFSKELIGLSQGEVKTIKHSYPQDGPFERFNSKEIEFQVTVDNIKEMELPELNDEFAQSLGDYESLDDLRSSVKENLEANKKQEYEQDYVSEVIDQILSESKVKYSPNLVEEEEKAVLENIEHELSHRNLDLETYLKTRETDRETYIEEEVKPVAIRRLERSLVLDEIARKEDIDIKQEELQAGVTETMTQIFNTPGFKKPRSNQDMRKLANVVSMDTASRMLNQKILDHIRDIASGKIDEQAEEPVEEQVEPVESTEPEVPSQSQEQGQQSKEEQIDEAIDEQNIEENPEAGENITETEASETSNEEE
jgi:trigger factor